MQEVDNGRSFAQKFGIGGDVEEMTGDPIALHGTANPFIGIDGDGAFFDDDLVGGKRSRNLARYGFDIGEVCVAGFTLGSSYRDKNGFALARCLAQVSHEADFRVAVSLQKFRKMLLVNGGIATLKCGDLAFVVVDTDDLVAHLCEADRCDETDITRPDHRNFYSFCHRSKDGELPFR